MNDRYRVGLLVTHPNKPEWGPGKVVAIGPGSVTVYFRDASESKPGDALKRINVKAMPLSVATSQTDPWLDALPPLKEGKMPMREVRVTSTQAIEQFLRVFPKGFSDPKYLEQERDYKVRAHEKYVETLGNGKAEAMLGAGQIDEVVARVLACERAVNLLSRFEKAAFADGLKNRAGAHAYVEALFGILSAPTHEQAAFDRLVRAVTDLPADEGRARVAAWPVLTLLPFLAQPTRFMFLKPEVTQKAAERLAFNLNYSARLNWLTYSRLLDMAALLTEMLTPIGARDLIDVQSFIWVTGTPGYKPA